MASWVNNMSLARGAHLVPGSTLMPKWEDRSGISIVQQNVNLLPKNKQQDPMLTKGPLFELAGKLETCNIHASLHTQLVNHNYFKSLYVFTTFEKVVDVVYEKVTYVEPWASRGDTTPSSAWIFLLKLFTLRLSEEQVTALLNHGDSPYLRAMGALYVRYGCEPAQLWRWLGPYADDLEEFAPSCDPNALMTFGGYCVKLLTDNAYYNTALPALPVAVQRAIKVSLVLHDEQVSRGKKNARWIGTAKLEPGATVRAIYDDYESDPKWFSAQIEAVVPPYDGAAEGTLPTYTVIFAQGSRDTIKLGQIDVQKAVKAEAAHPAEEPQRSKSRERRRRRDDSRSDDDDDRKHKSRRRRHRSRSRDRSRRDRGDGDGARDAEPQPARRPAPRDDGEVDDGEVQIFDARICKFKPVVEAPQDGALPVGESVLAGRDILGAVMRQERNNAVCEGKGVMRSRPVAFDTSLITPASAKVATYRKRSKSRDRLANVVAPLQRHLEDDRRADDRRADDRKAPRADSPPSDDDRRRRRDRKEDRKDDRRDDHRDDRREDRKDSRREDRGSRKDDRKDRRRRSRSR
ncbi:PRP38 family-domain-containing protein [Pelagophyceae sp. CCMP2097]|nr:PRP38 family-domain-containing protein [Pelagophyceae sp. CCMP2097]